MKKRRGYRRFFRFSLVRLSRLIFLLDLSLSPRLPALRAARLVGKYTTICPCTVSVHQGFPEFGAFICTMAVRPHSPRAIHAAAFSAIIKVGELVLPLVIKGITPASTTRRPAMPLTRKCESTTAIGSSAAPILVVPTG